MDISFSVIVEGKSIEVLRSGLKKEGYRPLISYYGVSEGFALVLGRLYYRNDRIIEIESPCGNEDLEKVRVNDAALALTQYRRFGQKGLNRLEGDFSLVVYDRIKDELIGHRDPMGGYPLYWINTHGKTAFSSSLLSLARLLPGQDLNFDYIAEYLTAPAPFNELDNESCVYEAIHRVVPGHTARASLRSGTVRQTRYWDWREKIPAPDTIDRKTIARDYEQGLCNAVNERMKGLTCAHLSGGMDSTAVALIASRLIGENGWKTPLHTISLVYDKLEELAQERPYLETVLEKHKEITAHCVLADGFMDFDSFSDPPLHDEPHPGLWRLALDRATIDCAVANGTETLLTGIGADEMLDVQPYHITDLLKRGRFHKAWTEATRWARDGNCSPWEILTVFGIANLPFGRFFKGKTRGDLIHQDKNAVAAWILPDFAGRLDLKNRSMEKARKVIDGYSRSTPLSMALSSIESRTGDFNRWYVAAPSDLAIAHPFLDPRMLSLGLGIISKIRPVPGRMKPILAEAMRGILPENIRNRRRKGHFNEVYYRGLSKNLDHLETLIQQTEIGDLGLFDRQEFSRSLRQAALGGVGVRACQHLNFSLSFIKWFSMQDRLLHRKNPHTTVVNVARR